MDVARYINPYRMFNGSIIPNWLMIRKEINSSTKLVYARLGQYAGKKGVAWPQKETLAREVGLSKDMVSLCLEKLTEHKLIEVEQRPVPGRPNQSNVYRFLDHSWIHEADEEDDENPSEGGGGSPLPPRGEPAPPRGGNPLQGRGEPATRSGRESREEIQIGRESGHCEPPSALAVPAEPTSPPGPAEGPSPPTSPTPPTIGTTHEEEQDSPPAAGREQLNPPAFDVEALKSRQAQEARARAEKAVTRGEQKYDEAHRRKLARANAKENWRASVEDMIPPESPERSPLGQLQYVWKTEWIQAFPDLPPPKKWGGKENGQAQLLLDRYELVSVQTAIEYVIRNWPKLCTRWFKKDPTKGGIAPSMGLVLRMHDAVVPEATVWEKHRDVVREYDSFGDRYEERPAELRARYLEAQKELQALGL